MDNSPDTMEVLVDGNIERRKYSINLSRRALFAKNSRVSEQTAQMEPELRDGEQAVYMLGDPIPVIIRTQLRTPESQGCNAPLESGQWWGFCGETDMGQALPALCQACGGEFKARRGP